MNDFTKNITQALFNPDEINELLHSQIEHLVNNIHAING